MDGKINDASLEPYLNLRRFVKIYSINSRSSSLQKRKIFPLAPSPITSTYLYRGISLGVRICISGSRIAHPVSHSIKKFIDPRTKRNNAFQVEQRTLYETRVENYFVMV